CDDRRSDWRFVVDAEVRPVLAQNWVQPAARKTRRDNRHELEWRLQEEAPHRDAALVVVAGDAPLRCKAHRPECPPCIVELGSEDRTITGEFAAIVSSGAAAVLFLHDELEPIAWLDVDVEVDLAAENCRD